MATGLQIPYPASTRRVVSSSHPLGRAELRRIAPLSRSASADALSVATMAYADLSLPNGSRKLGLGSLPMMRRPAFLGIISARCDEEREREAA
jgi:hypothetical protein